MAGGFGQRRFRLFLAEGRNSNVRRDVNGLVLRRHGDTMVAACFGTQRRRRIPDELVDMGWTTKERARADSGDHSVTAYVRARRPPKDLARPSRAGRVSHRMAESFSSRDKKRMIPAQP